MDGVPINTMYFDCNIYTYNSNGIRTSKTINGVKHTYTLDGTKIITETWQELGEDNTEQTRVLTPLYDNEESVCGIMYDGALYYFLKNLQGDIIAITNQNGVTLARYAYDAWGACTITEDNSNCNIATINPFRYRGYYYDAEIGMYYLQSRYYCVAISRFLNNDSIMYLGYSGSVASYNICAYCENDSVNYTDSCGYKTGQQFYSADRAARDFADLYNKVSIRNNWEYGTFIYSIPLKVYQGPNKYIYITRYSYYLPWTDYRKDWVDMSRSHNTKGYSLVAFAHTHAAYSPNFDSEYFSYPDIMATRSMRLDAYLVTPGGNMRKYSYSTKKRESFLTKLSTTTEQGLIYGLELIGVPNVLINYRGVQYES
jgi:RHS repeat-associated protein